MAKYREVETIPDLLFIGATIENQIINRSHLCSELQALVVDYSNMAALHRKLTQARESVRHEGLWRQFTSIEKMLALESMMTSDAEAERQKYLALARIAEAHGMGPVYLLDAQRRAFTVTQARKVAGLQGGTGVATELPEITWYEGFSQRFPDYDWEADCLSARIQLIHHYAVLNDNENLKHNLYSMATLAIAQLGPMSPAEQACFDTGIDRLINLAQHKGELTPNIITPAQERFMERIGLSPRYIEAAKGLKLTGVEPCDLRLAMDQYFSGVGDCPNIWDRLAAINRLLSALGLWSDKAEPMDAELVEDLDQRVKKTFSHKY
ncbi:hypothetical protein F52700_589 [Fusarium sp. NRRL 52700]|nr:hypothetical protein F52700_589 [Fusarium sp. NRRL 52700]